MATETHTVVSDHHPTIDDQPIEKKVNEEIQTTKPEGIPPSKDDENKDEEEDPKAGSSSVPEIPTIKLEESPIDIQMEPPTVVMVEKEVDDAPVLDVAVEAGSRERDISIPEPQTVVKQSDEKPAIEALESVPNVKEEMEAVENLPDEKLECKTVGSVSDEEPASKPVANEPEDNPATEAVESLPDEKPASEAVANEPEDKPATEAVETVPDEKPDSETIANVPEDKPANEAIESIPDDKPASEAVEGESEDKPATKSVENVLVEKPVTEAVENKLEEKAAMEVVENEAKDKPSTEPVEKQLEEKPDIKTEPNLLAETVVQPVEHSEDIPTKSSETEVEKQPEEVSEVECKTVEKPISVTELEDKRQEQPQVTYKVVEEKTEAKSGEDVEGEVVKDEGTKTTEFEGSVSLNEEKISETQDPCAIESSASSGEGAPVLSTEAEKDSIISVVEKAVTEDTNGDASAVDVSEGLLKDETVVTGKIEEEKEAKNVKVEEESEEKNAKLEELIESKTTKFEDVSGSNIVAEVAEKSFEGEQGSKDLELVEEIKPNVKEDTPTSVEKSNDEDLEAKVNETIVTSTTDEPKVEPKDSELDVEAEETLQADANLEKSNEAVDEVKSETQTSEPSKDGDDTKTSRDLPTQEVSVKPAHKSSGNIMSKVKQSIVKVKKAIIGKSPNPKAFPEAKADEKVK